MFPDDGACVNIARATSIFTIHPLRILILWSLGNIKQGVIRGVAGVAGATPIFQVLFHKTLSPQTLKPQSPQASKPQSTQAIKHLSPQALKPTSPQALKPLSPKALKPTSPQTLKPSNP